MLLPSCPAFRGGTFCHIWMVGIGVTCGQPKGVERGISSHADYRVVRSCFLILHFSNHLTNWLKGIQFMFSIHNFRDGLGKPTLLLNIFRLPTRRGKSQRTILLWQVLLTLKNSLRNKEVIFLTLNYSSWSHVKGLMDDQFAVQICPWID